MHTLKTWFWIGILAFGLIACRSSAADGLEPTFQPAMTDSPPLQVGEVRQWAAGAEASSEFADPEWAAIQAVGEPNTPRCGDYQTAWATAGSDIQATLVLTFTQDVHVTGINIVQSFNPDQVSRVELVGNFNRGVTVYASEPRQVDQPCPFVLTIPVEKTEQTYDKVRITIDQSVLGLGWNQIDAVELLGDLE
jgi:hypothetical protein